MLKRTKKDLIVLNRLNVAKSDFKQTKSPQIYMKYAICC
jgi:hypothetical protein